MDPTFDNPLRHLDDWDDDLRQRYVRQDQTLYRDYSEQTRAGVLELYRQNHRRQTVDFVRGRRERFSPPRTRRMGVWQAMEYLNAVVDESDPDLDLPQIAHAIQTAEGIRADGHPEWFVLTGLLHDLGKVLCLFDEPQWAVVGDTFPVGCPFSPKIVCAEFFETNPDLDVPAYQAEYGIYSRECGLDSLLMSWGHDEYLYHVMKPYLPVEALYMIRYHSFYAAHHEGEYAWALDSRDRRYFPWVKKFNRYDLYTKSDCPPDLEALTPVYRDLVSRWFPEEIWW